MEWIKIIAALVGGGFAGAIFTNALGAYQSRKQSVGTEIAVTQLFAPGSSASTFQTTLKVWDGEQTYDYTNLYVADIQMINQGNRDIESFSFGLTLSGKDTAVAVDSTTRDRHHKVVPDPEVTPKNPSKIPNFILAPFNRDDMYRLKVFLVAGGDKPMAVQLSTAQPVRFVGISSSSAVSSTLISATVIMATTLAGMVIAFVIWRFKAK
jgi:hypothetical protein